MGLPMITAVLIVFVQRIGSVNLTDPAPAPDGIRI